MAKVMDSFLTTERVVLGVRSDGGAEGWRGAGLLVRVDRRSVGLGGVGAETLLGAGECLDGGLIILGGSTVGEDSFRRLVGGFAVAVGDGVGRDLTAEGGLETIEGGDGATTT